MTLTEMYFQYQGKIFKQVYGCAMVFPISSIIAQILLEGNILENDNQGVLFFKDTWTITLL